VSKVRQTGQAASAGCARARYDHHKGKGESIFTNIRPTGLRSVETGVTPGSGTFFCVGCGSHLSLLEEDVLPDCPNCGGSTFRRDSIFESMQDHGGTTAEFAMPRDSSPPDWLDEAREMLAPGGRALALRETEGPIEVFEVEEGWTRIGRSAAADLRLDDPSVSRRHALVVCERPRALRVLDDRSLNGVRVNDERIEWARLVDGDALGIGRYRLFVLEA
jgi:predicted  nucleic acid-binding Zn-ribbon protein